MIWMMNNLSHPSRRTMLKLAAATAGSLPLGAVAAGAEPAPSTGDPWRGLKVGVASYSYRKLPLDACIKGIQRVALHYVSIKEFHLPLGSSQGQRKEVAQKFRDAGITPISCGVIALKNDESSSRNAFEYARDIGAPTIVCDPAPEALPLLDRLVKQFDIRLAIHNHGPEAKHFKSPYDAWKAVQKFDERIGLCIDVGHSARAGADPAEAIRACKARLYDLHFKDIADRKGKNAGTEVEVGRGVLDTPAMLQAMLEINYAGHIGFEHEKDPQDPIPGVAESVGYTKGVLREMK